MRDVGTSGPPGSTPSADPARRRPADPTSHGAGFRPSRWNWTTLASILLIIGLTYPITSTATALAPFLEPTWRGDRGSGVGIPEVVGRGWALAVLPSAIVLFAAWRIRRRGDEEDLRSAAAFGAASVAVLAVDLLIGLLELPRHPEPRLVVLTTLFVVGVVLLGTSLWVRHVPRP